MLHCVSFTFKSLSVKTFREIYVQVFNQFLERNAVTKVALTSVPVRQDLAFVAQVSN